MQLKIIKPGLHTSIQDLGRTQYLSQAVPLSGAMDPLSARLANLAIGNMEHHAVLEFTYANASFQCTTDLLLAYAGGGAALTVEGQMLPAKRALFLPAGSLVTLVNSKTGIRTYLAIAGGWDVPTVLGSKSSYLPAGLGGYQGRLVKKDDLLNSCNTHSPVTAKLLDQLGGQSLSHSTWGIPAHFLRPAEKSILRIFPGREISWFEPDSIINLLAEPFQVDLKSNRMGILLKGKAIRKKLNEELLSTAVCPGTIQVTGNGEMILLMADCQTTGGYPRIAQVAMVDLPLCAQLKPHEQIYFSLISAIEAESLYFDQETELQRLALAIELKS